MSTGPKNSWGGARPNSGPKSNKPTVTERQVKRMLAEAMARAKKEGKTIDGVLLDIIYDADGKVPDKLAAIKLFKDFTMAKTSESNVNVKKVNGPAIGLPASKPDPAKLVPIAKAG